MAASQVQPPTLEKLYDCAQTLSNAKGLVQTRVSIWMLIRKTCNVGFYILKTIY